MPNTTTNRDITYTNFSGGFRDSCPLNGSCLRHMFLQPPGEGILQNVLAL